MSPVRLRVRDAVAVLLFAAVLVPYIGYLVNGDMPLIDNARSMASTGLFLGGAAFWVIRSGRPLRLGRVEGVAAALALALYISTIAFAATTTAAFLLAAFMGSLALVFALDLLDRPRRGVEPDR